MAVKSAKGGIGAELAGRFEAWSGKKAVPDAGPRVVITSAGIDCPYDMTLRTLLELRDCDVLFADRLDVREQGGILRELCRDVRPIPGTTGSGISCEKADEETWKQVSGELDKKRKVGFVTNGHPLLLGGARILATRCRRNGYRCDFLTSVSAADSVITAMNEELGSFLLADGFSVVHAEDILEAGKWSSALPTIVYSIRNCAKDPRRLAKFCRIVSASYGPREPLYAVSCRTPFSQRYVQSFLVKELGSRLGSLIYDPSLVLPGA